MRVDTKLSTLKKTNGTSLVALQSPPKTQKEPTCGKYPTRFLSRSKSQTYEINRCVISAT